MADLKHLKVEEIDGVARITFARPKHNVLNIEMMNELNAELERILTDNTLKCIVILGEGPNWSAGMDVGEHAPDKVDEMISSFNRIFELLIQFDVPIIAAVHGRALGGGMEIAIACDIIIATESAVFGQPEIKLGFFPPYAAIRLPQLVGPAKAVEICTTGMAYTAGEAQKMGMVAHVVKDDEFQAEVDRIVKEIQAGSPLIIRLNKRAVKKFQGLDFASALTGVTDLFLGTLIKTEDTLEGIQSFYEKRRPEWKNK